MDELLPCPFCGSPAEWEADKTYLGHGDFREDCYVRCSDTKGCGANIRKRFPIPADAAEAWNTRATPQPRERRDDRLDVLDRISAKGEICERWKRSKNFLADMGPAPKGKPVLYRLDPSKPFSKDNCRWGTLTDACRHRKNARLTYDKAVKVGLMLHAGYSQPEIAEKFGCSRTLISEMKRGNTWKDAMAEADRISSVLG